MKISITRWLLVFAVILSCNKDTVKLKPVITYLTPEKGAYNITVAIHGNNFDSLPNSTSVTFNGVAAQVVKVSDTLITAIVPMNATTGKISVIVEDRTGVSNNDFVILPGKWVLKKNPVAPGFVDHNLPVSFVIGNKAYVGLGGSGGGDTYKDLWEYDPVIETWTRKADCGIRLEKAMAIVINNKAYVGFGWDHTNTCCGYQKQIWEYDPATNTWTRKADFPGQARAGAFGIGLNGKGYMGLGLLYDNSNANDWWQYDPSTDIWTQKANPFSSLPGQGMFYSPTGFSVDNKIFVGTAAYYSSRDWFQYDPITDTWLRKADYPGNIAYAPSAFVLGNKGYVAGGGQECWEYDPSLDKWTQLAFFDFRMGGAAFSMNNKGYYVGGSFKNDFWEFIP